MIKGIIARQKNNEKRILSEGDIEEIIRKEIIMERHMFKDRQFIKYKNKWKNYIHILGLE